MKKSGCDIQTFEADISCKNFVKKWGDVKAVAAYEFLEICFKSTKYTRATLDFGESRPSDKEVS